MSQIASAISHKASTEGQVSSWDGDVPGTRDVEATAPETLLPSLESVWEPVIHSHFTLSARQALQVLPQRPPAFFTHAIPEDHHQPITDKEVNWTDLSDYPSHRLVTHWQEHPQWTPL